MRYNIFILSLKGMKRMRIRAVIWDLDGTLLDTLDDLAASINWALAQSGLPPRTTPEVRAFVGDGVAKLVERALPDGARDARFDAVYAAFVRHYGAHDQDHTRPYPGVTALLDALCARGVRHAIVSNKIDFAVRDLSRAYFGERIAAAVGDDPSRRRKPAPDGVLEAMRRLDARAEETVYVGDSEVDVRTARNAGVTGVAVSWGFRDEATLRAAGATRVCATPEALLEEIESL